VLTNLPLLERIPLYENILRPVRGRVEFSHRQVAASKAEVVAALNAAIDRREEGVVLKDPDSVYKPNARAGGGWVKLKPEYENELIDQLDLVVLGGYYGSGGGGGTVTQFLMGVRDASAAAAVPPRFLAICRVGTGYSGKVDGLCAVSVLRIRIRMFLGLLDPDPLVRGYGSESGSESFYHQAK